MKVFDTYSEYYDLLYSTKDYAAEVNYVSGLLKQFNAGTRLLELGCGTGLHACLLAQQGYYVRGIDQSDVMLHKAAERKKNLPDIASQVSFTKSDIRSFVSEEKYDAVISLFHVMSYMTKNEDLQKAFLTAKRHLKPKGIFIFDCWHGPGVQYDPPVSRKKDFENEDISVNRVSKPDIFPDENRVDVNFEIAIRNKKNNEIIKLHEVHSMRYLFTDELKKFAEEAGMEMVCAEEWLTKKGLSNNSWNACYVCRNKS